jgi:hypothetical protein
MFRGRVVAPNQLYWVALLDTVGRPFFSTRPTHLAVQLLSGGRCRCSRSCRCSGRTSTPRRRSRLPRLSQTTGQPGGPRDRGRAGYRGALSLRVSRGERAGSTGAAAGKIVGSRPAGRVAGGRRRPRAGHRRWRRVVAVRRRWWRRSYRIPAALRRASAAAAAGAPHAGGGAREVGVGACGAGAAGRAGVGVERADRALAAGARAASAGAGRARHRRRRRRVVAVRRRRRVPVGRPRRARVPAAGLAVLVGVVAHHLGAAAERAVGRDLG